jgi:hypothetical protein
MEKRGVWLSGIARVLNAGGSALLDVYDAVTAITTGVSFGEKGNLRVRLREYEKKIESLYCEIGKEVVLHEETAHLSEAGEAGIKQVAEYQAEIEKIKQRIQNIEAEEKAAAAAKKEAARERAPARVKTAPEPRSEPIAGAEEYAVTVAPEDSSPLAEAATEETKDVLAEAAETPAPEMAADAAESAEPEAAEESTDNTPVMAADTLEAAEPEPEAAAVVADAGTKEAATTEALEMMLKRDLLKLCKERGIEADKRMTKAGIIELILK